MRSTTKYWVRTTDISAVKHHILQHLPVFQYNEGSVRRLQSIPNQSSVQMMHMGPPGPPMTLRLT